MAYPPQYREQTPNLPSILSSGPGRYGHHDMNIARSTAISIPRLETTDACAPPPLPPPRFVPTGPQAYVKHKSQDPRERSHPTSYATTGYESMESDGGRPSLKRLDTGNSRNGDEGYASYTPSASSRESMPTDFGLHHNRFHFQSAADLHGDSMKKKLDALRPLDRSPLNDAPRRHFANGRLAPSPNIPVQLPIHSRSAVEPQSHFPKSPIAAPFRHFPLRNGADSETSPRGRTRRNNSGDSTYSQGYEYTGAEDMEIDEVHSATGHKRRAASPPRVERLPHSATSDGRRRELGNRGSPTPRLSVLPQASSLSSMSSAAISRSNSYISTMSTALSSITTNNSFGRRSPGPNSPTDMSQTSCSSPFTTPTSLAHSPHASVSSRSNAHNRGLSANSPRKLSDLQKPGGSRVQRVYMCECCPKKPRKFDTAEGLSAHEAEKQYECSFCGNRFKNKNEMERHQNSLHVRRHSWSCSALSGYDRAFHESTSRPGEADTCGYCGEEFLRSGPVRGNETLSAGVAPKHVTEQDWDERIRHLQDAHKFRECNSSKKFYRADHFRQHLKHSHAGTSGKWTNMLENACMMEEDPTPR